ncbi:hypothetical protein GmHk_14G040824 [Glycine max]|nr:hypothetical protein GmHk_14G040824 [Glycine max]
MVKPRNILLILKEHNANSYTTIKQIYNARSAYRSSIRGSDIEMQQLMKLLKLDYEAMHSYNLIVPTKQTCIAWGSLIDCPSKEEFDECLKKFEIAFSPWSMFVDYVNQTWIIPHKDVDAMPSKNSLAELCSVWEAMNNMITLQHTKIKASFETSTHVVGYVFKVTLYKKLLGMVSRYALNQIATGYEHVSYAGIDSSHCRCVMRTTHGLPCAWELARYVVSSIPLGVTYMFWWRLSFANQGLSKPEVSITEEMKIIFKLFEELDVCGKVSLKSKLREIAYPDLNSMCPSPEKVKTKCAQKKPMTKHQRSTINSSVKGSASSFEQAISRRTMPMLDQFHPCIHDSIENIIYVKADGNCGYRIIVALLGMGEDSWSLVRNHLLKELAKWSYEYINLLGGIDRFKELKWSLLIDGLSMVTMDKRMKIIDIGYVIASRYNVILVSLSLQQSMTFFSLKSQSPTDCFMHRMWLYDNLNVLVYDAYVLKMDEDQWTYDYAMSQEVHMDYDYDNEEECGMNEPHVDCSNAFNTSQVFGTRDDVLQWARIVAHENGYVVVIMRSDTDTGSRGRSSFVLIGCERSGTYKCRNKEFVRKDTGSRKCGCPFRLRGKPVHGGEGWMVKLICGIHNHELTKSLVGHPYAGRLIKDEKKIIADMTKSMVKPKDMLLTLKEHNVNSCTTIKQIYNARSAYRSSIRGADTEMQHLIKLLEHSTYKTNRCRLPLLDFVEVTPTAMTFSAGFAYLEAERVNNIVWALERFRGLFLRNDRLPVVIVTDRDLALMNAVKTVFLECTNLLCRFHIDKNVKAKCKSLIGEKNVWDYAMDNWGTLVDCPSEHQFAESLQKFQIACSPWLMFIDYVNDTWIIPHKEKFITTWTNKVMHLGNTTTNRVESAHWAFKRVLQNSVGDLCSVWDAMNNIITLQHVEI